MGKSLTYEYVKNFVECESNSGCELISQEYVHNDVKLNIRCKCGNDFWVKFSNFQSESKKKRQCNECGQKIITSKKRRSIESVYAIISDANHTFKRWIDEYIGQNSFFIVECDKLHEYKTCMAYFTTGSRCPICENEDKKIRYLKPHNVFVDEMHSKHGDEFIVLSEYLGAFKPIHIKHNIEGCGYEWSPVADAILRSQGCPKCNGGVRSNMSQLQNSIFDLVQNEYSVSGTYVNSQTKVEFKHNICNNIFHMTPNNFLQGQRCPICKESKGEQTIRKFFTDSNIEFIPQYTYSDLLSEKGNPLRFDFAMTNNSLVRCLIEYDGQGHYIPTVFGDDSFELTQKHDKIKNEYCLKNNIPLHRIPYWEFDNIDEILNNIIHNN